jgi:ATP adenylyltransferase
VSTEGENHRRTEPSGPALEPGTLWDRTTTAFERASKSGALQPIGTESALVPDGGVDFVVRIISSLLRKDEERGQRDLQRSVTGEEVNPFLPYERAMFVADVSTTHLCLLNKFNVIDHHLLIVTREFESQERLLTEADLEAMWRCMAEFKGLAFYNGGRIAGASERHKHLQMIPLPIADVGLEVPIEPLLASVEFEGRLGRASALPFVHRYAETPGYALRDPARAAAETLQSYRAMLEEVGLNRRSEPPDAVQSAPYNLLVTRDWMLLVPRSREFFEGVSINAIAFSGGLLVRNRRQLAILSERGPMAALREAAVTPSERSRS